MLLNTCGGVGKEFFNNIQPCNLYLEDNKRFRMQIERFLRNICRYNHVVDAMVEVLDDKVLRIVDCKLTQGW